MVYFHYQVPGARREDSEVLRQTDFVRSFLAVNFVFGGEERMRAAFRSLCREDRKNVRLHEELLFTIPLYPEVRSQRKAIFDRAKYRSLDELRAMMNAQGVVN